MVRLRVLFGVMFGTALMGLSVGYELGQRSRNSEKDSTALPPVCSIENTPNTSLPCDRIPQTIRVQCIKVEYVQAELGQGLASELTGEMVKAIEARAPYEVTASKDADMELNAVIKEFRQQAPPDYLKAGSDLRDIETHLVVQMMWKDLRTGRSLLLGKDGSSPAAVTLRSVAYYRPELGQLIDQPRQENIRAVVEQMLGQMESTW